MASRKNKNIWIIVGIILLVIMMNQPKEDKKEYLNYEESSACEKKSSKIQPGEYFCGQVENEKKEAISGPYTCRDQDGPADAYVTDFSYETPLTCVSNLGGYCWQEYGTSYSFTCNGNNVDGYWKGGQDSLSGTCGVAGCSGAVESKTVQFDSNYPQGQSFTFTCLGHDDYYYDGVPYAAWCYPKTVWWTMPIKVKCQPSPIGVDFCQDGDIYHNQRNEWCEDTPVIKQDCAIGCDPVTRTCIPVECNSGDCCNANPINPSIRYSIYSTAGNAPFAQPGQPSKLCTKFTPSATGYLNKIEVGISGTAGTLFYGSVRQSSCSGSEIISASSNKVDATWNPLEFGTDKQLIGGTAYYLVLSANGPMSWGGSGGGAVAKWEYTSTWYGYPGAYNMRLYLNDLPAGEPTLKDAGEVCGDSSCPVDTECRVYNKNTIAYCDGVNSDCPTPGECIYQDMNYGTPCGGAPTETSVCCDVGQYQWAGSSGECVSGLLGTVVENWNCGGGVCDGAGNCVNEQVKTCEDYKLDALVALTNWIDNPTETGKQQALSKITEWVQC